MNSIIALIGPEMGQITEQAQAGTPTSDPFSGYLTFTSGNAGATLAVQIPVIASDVDGLSAADFVVI